MASSWNPAGAKILPLNSSADRMSTSFVALSCFFATLSTSGRNARSFGSAAVATNVPLAGTGTSGVSARPSLTHLSRPPLRMRTSFAP